MKYLYYVLFIIISTFISYINLLYFWIAVNYEAEARRYLRLNRSDLKSFIYRWFVWIWLNDKLSHPTIDMGFLWDHVKSDDPQSFLTRHINKLGPKELDKSFYARLITLLKNNTTNFDRYYSTTMNEDLVFKFSIGNAKFGWYEEIVPKLGKVYKLYFINKWSD